MKKKILIIAVAASLLALTIAGTSVAYFTDTDEYTNVFTAGNVKISLTEAVAEKDSLGHIRIGAPEIRIDYNDNEVYRPLFPMQIIEKDPRITNTGSELAYVGAIIDVTNANNANNANGDLYNVLSATATEGKTTITDFIKGIDTSAAIVKVVEITNGFRIYVIYNDYLETTADDNSVTIFNEIQIPATWDNAQMACVNGLTVEVQAFATQVAGFNDAEEAILGAFGSNEDFTWSAYPTNP